MKRRARRALCLAAGFTLGVLTSSLPGFAVTTPALSVEPASTPAGREVLVTGTDFPAGDPIEGVPPPDCRLTWGPVPLESTCQVDEQGQLIATFIVPVDAKPGDHVVTATATDGFSPAVSATARVQVVPVTVVPDLVGSTLERAGQVLAEVGLVLRAPGAGTGIVVDQEPAPQTLVPPGSTVVVRLSTPPTESVVPDVTTRTVREALDQLAEAGLLLSGGGSDVERRIAGQVPAPGAVVPEGSTVAVTLAPIDAQLISVPDLREPSITQARTTLVGGLTLIAALAFTAAIAVSRHRPPRPGQLRLIPHPDTAIRARVVAHDDGPLPDLHLEPHPDHRIDLSRTEVSQ